MESISIIKKIFKVHPITYLFIIIFIGIGAYKEFIIISTLIIIHELGHFLCAKVQGIKSGEIILYPLGGITKLQMNINENPKKEFLILIMGPLFQNIAYFLLLQTSWNIEQIKMYHYGILCFNLLPIYPLDGGKLLNIGINYFYPYKLSFKISIYISYLVTIIILFQNQTIRINAILIYIFLILMIRKEELKKNLYFHKFIMERLLRNYNYQKKVEVTSIHKLYRYRKNIIKEGNKRYEEKEYLSKKYKFF